MKILIEPVGIETSEISASLLNEHILIEPVGIETVKLNDSQAAKNDFNRTSWN